LDSVVFPDVRLREMRTGIGFIVSPSDRLRLAAIISAPSSPQKHVWRARIVLLSADGTGTSAIMSATGKSKTCVWRWQERFMVAGVVGLLREKTRPPGIPKTAADKTAEVIRLTQAPPPPDATHWTLRAMAKAVGLAASTVQGIWQAHGHHASIIEMNAESFRQRAAASNKRARAEAPATTITDSQNEGET